MRTHAPAPVTPPHERQPASEARPERERSRAASVLTAIGVYGKMGKGLLIDRPRVLAAYPIARAKGGPALRRWWVELGGGYATNHVVPITGDMRISRRLPAIPKGWDHSYRASVIAGATLIGASTAYGLVNLGEALHDGGTDALVDTRTGRTGALGSIVGVLNLGVIGAAMVTARGHGSTPLARAATRFGNSFLEPIHSNTAVTIARGVSALPVLVNELGFLDFLNRGATSDPLTNARDTAVHLLHKLPGLDHALPADVKPAPGEVPA